MLDIEAKVRRSWVGNGSPPTGDDPPPTGSGSSSSAPAVDPIVAQRESLFRQAYVSLWGEPPTEEYIKTAAQAGMNTFEFIARERHKEAFKNSHTYQSEFKALLTAMRQLGAA